MANDIPLDKLLGITKEPVETMSHSDMLRNNLKVQHEKVSAEVGLLEKQLADKREYLAKIEGGLDVLDELQK
mgnify:CR=1 FL=1|jgi:hypothetical protein|tara:strand:- start:105 stop:320 length:216 start_codon:yes stop_codon:yes gene_type:complete